MFLNKYKIITKADVVIVQNGFTVMFALRQLVKNGLKLNVRNGQRNNLTILLFHDILLMSYLGIDEVISFVGHNFCFRNLVTSLHIVMQ